MPKKDRKSLTIEVSTKKFEEIRKRALLEGLKSAPYCRRIIYLHLGNLEQ